MTSNSIHQKLSGLVIAIGSLVFVAGGAFHPQINSSLGALGSAEFFQNFYMHIAHHRAWELIHGMILAGPVMWLIGLPAFWDERNRWSRTAVTTMTLAATAWAVTFVFDGFVAPYVVRNLAPEIGISLLAANQVVVIRMGLVSWTLLGLSVLVGSIGKLITSHARSQKILPWVGISLGTWALVAWATGVFQPGPFISHYWNVTAVSMAFWFLAVGVSLLISNPGAATATNVAGGYDSDLNTGTSRSILPATAGSPVLFPSSKGLSSP